MPTTTATTIATGAVLAGIGALHAAWGMGSTWPFADAATLSDTVVGSDAVPSPGACFAVAGALGAAATLVSGAPARLPRVVWLGRVGVGSVLGGRALLGAIGHTDLVSPGSSSPRFRSRDRFFYSPLCALLALGAFCSLRTETARRT